MFPVQLPRSNCFHWCSRPSRTWILYSRAGIVNKHRSDFHHWRGLIFHNWKECKGFPVSLHKWKCKNGSLRINPGSGEGQVLLSNYFSVFGKTKIILPFTWFGNFQLSLPLKLRKITAYSTSILLAEGSLNSSAINSLYFLLTPALNLGPNLPPCILFIVLSISWSNSIYSLTRVSFSVFIHCTNID